MNWLAFTKVILFVIGFLALFLSTGAFFAVRDDKYKHLEGKLIVTFFIFILISALSFAVIAGLW